jgi:hypothetical protein
VQRGILLIVALVAAGCVSRPPPAVPPSAATVVKPASPSATWDAACDGKTDECWMRSLADDPLEQHRAWLALVRAVEGAESWDNAPLAGHLDNWLDDRITCEASALPHVRTACRLGLAGACRHLYAVDGCARKEIELWPGSFAAPTWAPGTFAFVAQDLPLRSVGEAFGTVLRGAKVVVLGRRDEAIVIYVLDDRQRYPGSTFDERFVLEVSPAALSVTPIKRAPRVTSHVTAELYRRGVDDTLEEARIERKRGEEEHSWVSSACAPIELLDEVVADGKTFQRISQERHDVVLHGWINVPITRSWGPGVCSRRTIDGLESADVQYPIPGQYAVVDTEQTTRAVAKWMKSTGTLTMIEFDQEDGPRCVTQTWQRGDLLGEWGSSSDEEDLRAGRRWRSRQSFEVAGRSLAIHPGAVSSDGRDGPHVRCYDEWEVVRVTDEAIEVMPSPADQRAPRIRAYHPDDVTRWWFHPKACEAALSARPSYSLKEASRPTTAQSPPIVVGTLGC